GQGRRATEEVDGHDRLRPLGDAAGRVGGIDVQRRRLDVGEDGRRAPLGDRLRGRIEREGGADHLVAGTDLEGVQDQADRIGAVRDAERLRDPEEGGGLLLEGAYLRPEDETATVEDGAEPLFQLRKKGAVLRCRLEERDRGHGEPVYSAARGFRRPLRQRSSSHPATRSAAATTA